MERKKRAIKLSVIAVTLVAAIVSIVAYSLRKDSIKAEATESPLNRLTFEPTLARLERGRYLVEGPAHCFQCHSDVDWKTPGAQPVPGKKGGGTIFPEDALSWLVVPNISPDAETGADTWTDEQLARAIREGIGHDGRRLFPMMPYMNFSRSVGDLLLRRGPLLASHTDRPRRRAEAEFNYAVGLLPPHDR